MLVVGSHVRLHSLKAKPELNGKEGVCVRVQPISGGRWTVLVDGTELSMKPDNLILVLPPFKLSIESCSMQGLRNTQEDRHVKIPDLTKAARALKMPIDHLKQPCAFFAVYDGHCGHACSEFIAKGMHMKLLKKLSADPDASVWNNDRIESSLCSAFEEIDADFLAKFRTAVDGTTAVVALVVGDNCFVACAGDSRCVTCHEKADGGLAAAAFTDDHRPSLESEAQRILSVGGEVVQLEEGGPCRVAQGGYKERVIEIIRAEQQGLGTIGKAPVAMAVSRSLGDRDFKKSHQRCKYYIANA